MLTIQQLSQELDIGIDTLRVWERRYGYPIPQRDYRGHRSYPPEQLEELRIIKKLQNLGLRPGKIFSMTPAQRKAELEKKSTSALADTTADIERLLAAHPAETRRILHRQMQQWPLERFIHDLALPLIQALDHGWVSNRISIAREHLISDILADLLNDRIRRNQPDKPLAHLLFLTINGERHKLGLYLSAVLFQNCGITCTVVHEDLPISELPDLVANLDADGIALSFSRHYTPARARQDLASLRQTLPDEIRIIAGGHSVLKKFILPGVTLCADLTRIPDLCDKEFPVSK